MSDVGEVLALIAAFAVLGTLSWSGVVHDRAIFTGLPAATCTGLFAAMGVGFWSGQAWPTIGAGALGFGLVFVPLWRLGRSVYGKTPGLGKFERYEGPTTIARNEPRPETQHTSSGSGYSGGGGDFGGGGASGDY